jgi:DNA-binding transcriptional LysR family regulator
VARLTTGCKGVCNFGVDLVLGSLKAADRLNVSQPPFSKQIHDLEGELGIEFFERRRKGVALTPAGKSFLIDARRILEDCEASIRKAQRISRGEIGESWPLVICLR